MTTEVFTSWPSREALSREGRVGARKRLTQLIRLVVLGAMVWSAFSNRGVSLPGALLAAGGMFAAAWCARLFYARTLRHDLWPSIGLLFLMMTGALGALEAGFPIAAIVLWCGCAVVSLERLPLTAAVPCALIGLGAFAIVNDGAWLTTGITTAGLALSGYVLRLDAEARGSAQRLLAQERAAHAAEAESAALAERARIARDIHDVLAHSLSAQLVHLEAARLRIEREPHGEFRDQVLERVVAARSMAREGLAETRQALSALRGEMAPLGDYLGELAAADGADVRIDGELRALPAEASQAVRRVAQEALTNVRKHAQGAEVCVRLTYGTDHVTLEVRDSGGEKTAPAGLGGSGSGYGLLGMRERAELLGGTLETGPGGPDEKGFTVRLRVPA